MKTLTRRNLLLTLGTAAVTLTGLTTTRAADHAAHGGSPADRCARACANSLIECAKHVHHCTQHLADGHRAYAKCLEFCSACASSCSACIQSCFGPAGATAAESCAKMCDLCAAECEKFKDDDAMMQCAKTCRAWPKPAGSLRKSPNPHTRPIMKNVLLPLTLAVLALPPLAFSAPRAVLPDAVADLRTTEGTAMVNGVWRYSDTRITEIDHRSVGSDLKATGPKNRTFDFTPDARATDFDDSTWEVIPTDSLEKRRGNGRLSMNWYRLNVTIPEKLAGFMTKGSTVVFEIVVDDYAEVWVNGRAPFVLGQQGGTVTSGWNAPNRVVLTRDAKPGEKFQIAVLGINGPLSTHPDTYIWVRSATLDFYAPGKLSRAQEVKLDVERKDPALDTILPSDAKLEKLADGFAFTEGPVWVSDGEGYLLFSDPNNNHIYRLTPDGDVQPYLTKSGYAGADIGEYRQPGSNGLTLDEQGRLTICQHGNRRVVRIEKNGLTTVLADRFDGKRLNSPNDLVYRSDGTLFFTDPPFGLPKFADDQRREQPHFGVYAVKDGDVRLVAKDLTGPNGLAFSPDNKFLYVGNWDDTNKVVFRYPVNSDGALGTGQLFFDMTKAPGEDAIDGIKVDERGNVYVSGPRGLWILSARGRHLGTVRGPEHIHNMAWGDADRRTLFLAAQTGVYRLRLNVAGAGAAKAIAAAAQ